MPTADEGIVVAFAQRWAPYSPDDFFVTVGVRRREIDRRMREICRRRLDQATPTHRSGWCARLRKVAHDYRMATPPPVRGDPSVDRSRSTDARADPCCLGRDSHRRRDAAPTLASNHFSAWFTFRRIAPALYGAFRVDGPARPASMRAATAATCSSSCSAETPISRLICSRKIV